MPTFERSGSGERKLGASRTSRLQRIRTPEVSHLQPELKCRFLAPQKNKGRNPDELQAPSPYIRLSPLMPEPSGVLEIYNLKYLFGHNYTSLIRRETQSNTSTLSMNLALIIYLAEPIPVSRRFSSPRLLRSR